MKSFRKRPQRPRHTIIVCSFAVRRRWTQNQFRMSCRVEAPQRRTVWIVGCEIRISCQFCHIDKNFYTNRTHTHFQWLLTTFIWNATHIVGNPIDEYTYIRAKPMQLSFYDRIKLLREKTKHSAFGNGENCVAGCGLSNGVSMCDRTDVHKKWFSITSNPNQLNRRHCN